MTLRKGATFHSPTSSSSEHNFVIPPLPRRSATTLEDVIEAHKRRVAITLGDIDRGLSSVNLGSSSPTRQAFRDDGLPVPQGFLNHTVARSRAEAFNIMTNTMTDEPVSMNVSAGRTLRPRRFTRRPSNYNMSDSGHDSSAMSVSDKQSVSTGLTSMSDDRCTKSIVAASAITRSIAHSSTLESLPRLSERASNRIHEHILKPLLANSSLKDFHPILEDCPRRIHGKEIVCLRDLEKTLIFMAPVSESEPDEYVSAIAHWFSRCLKERSRTAKLYLDFCLTSIRCIQATVEFLHEREQTRPQDRPYTSGYFIDLVDQIRSYAQQVQASREKEEKGESLDEMDADPYVESFLPHSVVFGQDVTHAASLCGQVQEVVANSLSCSTDEVKLFGGLTRNGRPAELVRVKKNGKAISIATGQPVKLESIEDDEKGGVMMKRSFSQQEADDEAVMRSMARRKRSPSAAELAPKVCREVGCKKEFKRSCDLTKHEKTHSRPWKCSQKDCKYHEYGWPTEKELDRHVNDKHSDSPVLYKCKFHPCPYKSKRDSNCKQHMEKAHGWNYIRSKNNGKNRSKAGSTAGGSALPTPQTMNHRTPDSEPHEPFTPDEEMDDDYPMIGDYADYSGSVGFNNNIYGHHAIEIPEYPTDEFGLGEDISLPPFNISPVDSNSNMHSSTSTSPFINNSAFGNVDLNFGPNFASGNGTGNDFTLFEEDIYNARAQLPTPTHSIFQQPVDTYMSLGPNPLPHLSPIGHGNHMLYTPPTLNAVDDSFNFTNEEQQMAGNDFQLFSSANTNMMADSNQAGNLFGEVPSVVGGFSQTNTQEFFQAFYNQNTANNVMATEWPQQDDGYGFIDHN
jgi:hypothetical protein